LRERPIVADSASLSIDAGASWCRVLLLLTVLSGGIVCLERGQHFEDVNDRKNKFAIALVNPCAHHDLSGNLRHAFAIANSSKRRKQGFGNPLKNSKLKLDPVLGRAAKRKALSREARELQRHLQFEITTTKNPAWRQIRRGFLPKVHR
jgi:hypothetical protein